MLFNMPKEFDTVALANQGGIMEVEGPDGVVLRDANGAAAMTITLLGSDSQVFRKAQNRNLNKRLTKRNVKMTAEELEAETIDLLAEVTTGWAGFKDPTGNDIACSRQNAVALYSKYPFIREQADRFINERANFLPKSESSSSVSQSTSSGSDSPQLTAQS